ncbi:MAG: T9SS type A sorting domain-containing protein [Bacteroidota bacterium]
MKHLLTLLSAFIILNSFAQVPVLGPINGTTVMCTSTPVSLTYTVSATNSPFVYNWTFLTSSSGNTYSTGSNVITLPFTWLNQTYTIICSAANASGSSATQSLVVSVFETPNVNFSGSTTFCQGSSTSIQASSTMYSASSTVSYNWAPVTGLNTTTGSNVIANPTTPTNYTVTAVNGVCSNTAQITVAPFETMSVTFSGANTFCQGSSTNLSASSTIYSASPTISYFWSPGTGLSGTIGSNVMAAPSNATTYTVTASLGGSCFNTGTITVTPITLSVSVSGTTISCLGQPAALSASATVSQGSSVMSYNWSPPVGLNTTTGSSVTAAPPASTNYTVTASNGMCSNTTTITVIPFTELPVTISGVNTFCQGSSTNLTASSAASPTNSISYSWLPATGLNTTSGNAVIANPSTATNYTVTSTNGVCSSTQTITITPFEDIPVTIAGSHTFCEHYSTSLLASAAVSPTTSVSYSWLPVTDLNTANGALVNANPANATTYTVTAYFGTCTNTAQITVSQMSAPIVTAIATRTALCYGDTTTFTAYGAVTYSWLNGAQNGITSGAWFSGPNVVVGTGANGCTSTATVNMLVDNIALFTVGTNTMIFPGSGQSATLTINGTANTTYSMNGVATSTTVVVTPSVTTTYTFTSGNPSGCSYTYFFTQYVEYTVGVESISTPTPNYFSVYPNPSNGIFNIKSSIAEKVNITNELGQVIMSFDIEPETEKEISGLSSGIYVIQTGNKRTKIVVTQ